ncbi:MAG: hypothetical protein GY772_17740, partial [bacterium]|nr:hypothetical protein [bacterium]
GGSRSRSARPATRDAAFVGDAATVAHPYFRCRVGVGCLNYGSLRSLPAYNNMMLENLEDSPALLVCAQELESAQESAMLRAGWVSSGIYRGLCVLARRPVATSVETLRDWSLVDLAGPMSRFRISAAHIHGSQRVCGESVVPLCTFHLHNTHAKKHKRFVEFVGHLSQEVQWTKCRILCGDGNMRAFDLVPALAGEGIAAVMAARHCEFQRDPSQRCLDEVVLHDSLGLRKRIPQPPTRIRGELPWPFLPSCLRPA